MNGNDPFFETSAPPPTPPAPGVPGEDTSVMSTKDWLITMLILMIPCAGFIMPFVWAFGSGNLNRRNYFRAHLIMVAIGIVLGILLWAVIGALLIAALSSLSAW